MIEKWEDVIYNGVKIDGYLISNKGKVFSKKSNKLIKHRSHSGGYRMCTLWTPKQKECFIHRLVACAFIPNLENKKCINHIDGDKTNNLIDNLEWCTDSENQIHSHANGLHCFKGERNNLAKLTDIDVVYIRSSKLSTNELCNEFNVSSTCINDVRSRKSWKHI